MKRSTGVRRRTLAANARALLPGYLILLLAGAALIAFRPLVGEILVAMGATMTLICLVLMRLNKSGEC